MIERVTALPQKIVSHTQPEAKGLLQRKCACGGGGAAGMSGACSDCDGERLSRKARSASTGRRANKRQAEAHKSETGAAVPPIVHEVLSSSGQTFDPSTRRLMESSFGHDFSRVRVHTDGRAAESARAVNAMAYTVGQQMVFDAGQYQPQTREGRRLLAHELTHVVQQGAGSSGVQRFQGKLEIGAPHSSDEREADEAAAAIENGLGEKPQTHAKTQTLAKHSGSPTILRRKTGTTGSWFSGLFSSLVFGTFGFPEETLQAYLTKLDQTQDIEGDPDSDDKAREIANEWRKGGSKFVLTAQRKALLIQEMLDGPTMGADEDAILELLERSYSFELSYIFGAGGVTASRLNEDIPAEDGDRLREFYQRRFEGGMESALAGKIKPTGDPVPLGIELYALGSIFVAVNTFEKGSTGWDVPCVLSILCTQDRAIVENLKSLNVKMMERIDVNQWTFDGKSWNSTVVHPAGVNKSKEKLIGVLKGSNCNDAAQTMFHEVRHQNQPESVRATHYLMEIDAYTATEQWAIERGLPDTNSALSSLRATDERGVQTPSTKEIEKKVTQNYGGTAEHSTKEIKGHASPNITIFTLPNDKEDPQPSKEGERYLETPPKFINETLLNPKDWTCPEQKKEK
jgi:hypothetical protein